MIESKIDAHNQCNTAANQSELSPKEAARKAKVARRRSIEDYLERKRWNDEYSDIADLYTIEN